MTSENVLALLSRNEKLQYCGSSEEDNSTYNNLNSTLSKSMVEMWSLMDIQTSDSELKEVENNI
jgi:hypothetical protein